MTMDTSDLDISSSIPSGPTQAVPSAAVSAPDPFDSFGGFDSEEYETILGRQPIPPGDYLLTITDLAFAPNTPTTLLLSTKISRVLSVEPGATKPEGGVISERFNNFWTPAPGATENVVKAHRISVGRFKGVYLLATGEAVTGRIDGAFLRAARSLLKGREVVGRVVWTKRPPKGSKEKAQRISYTEWLATGKPDVFDNLSGFRALKPGE